MKIMRAATTLVTAACCGLVLGVQAESARQEDAPNTLTPTERVAGWTLLFDGTTTEGWRGFKQASMPDGWQARDGALTRVGPGGDIVSVDQFENFELRLEWKIEQGGNSGIFFRVSEDAEAVWHGGPEVQVLDNAYHPDGKSTMTSAGSDYALHAATEDVTRAVGEWNAVRILVDGSHVQHWMNGETIVEYELWSPDWERLVAESKFAEFPEFGRARRGHIALQDHGDPVLYRNIKIRPLPTRRDSSARDK